MSTIIKQPLNSGFSYKAVIRRQGKIIKTRTFKRKRDAMEWARRLEADEQRIAALDSPGARITFKDLADEYVTQWEGKDRMFLARLRYLVEQIGSKRLTDITKTTLKQVIDGYAEGRKAATVNRLKAAASVVLNWAVQQDYLIANPAKGLPHRPEHNKVVRWLSDDERARLLKACKESAWNKLYLLVVMALTTGARQGELLNIRWNDIDWINGTILLEETKNGDDRLLTPPQSTISLLKSFREVGNGLVFPSPIMPDKPFTFRKHWVKALERGGIENFRFHDLRHSAASYLVMSGATLHETASILGHKSLATTQRYAHLSTGHKKELSERVLGGLDG